PNWAIRLVIMLLVLGFPIALIIAWAFEATPEGIKRTEAADAAGERSRVGAWIYVVLIGATLRGPGEASGSARDDQRAGRDVRCEPEPGALDSQNLCRLERKGAGVFMAGTWLSRASDHSIL